MRESKFTVPVYPTPNQGISSYGIYGNHSLVTLPTKDISTGHPVVFQQHRVGSGSLPTMDKFC